MKNISRKANLPLILSACLSCALLSLTPLHANTSAAGKPISKDYKVAAVEHGKASWYSIKTNHGTETASGEVLTNHGATAAHKTLPMGTKVRVTNLANKKSEVVIINDRGPFKKGRIIDVTIGTAKRLGFVQRGIVPVKVEVLKKKKPATSNN